MTNKDKLLVVVSVLEGRRFPKRAKHKIVAEARFDGELLSTDPVDHLETPDFTQELAWELDKKGLQQHRLQRTSIKVQYYSVDIQNGTREVVGYVVLDLRSAQNTQNSKWYPLLHTKYHKSRPEVKLGLYIDEDKSGDQSFKAKEAPARKGEALPDSSGGIDPKLLKPLLNETEGFYQIGPREKCSEHFVLSVTIAFAANLPQLIPTNVPLPSTGYFFYYSLLGNDVTNEVFHDLINPTFPAERASVRLRSSVEALKLFFGHQPGLEIHICCGDQSLGSCDISLAPLLKPGSTEIYMKPVTIEGAFQMHPPNRMKQQLPPVTDEMKPMVGVSIVLRKEDLSATPVKANAPQKTIGSAESSPIIKSPRSKKSPAKERPKQGGSGEKKNVLEPPAQRQPSPLPPHEGSYSETFESGSKSGSKTDVTISSLHEDNKKRNTQTGEQARNKDHEPIAGPSEPKPVHSHHPHKDPDQPTAPHPRTNPKQDYGFPQQPQSYQSHQPHHFCCSIDLRSIQNLDIQHHANVFLRYQYQFFGSVSPIITNPPVEVRKGMEVTIPQSFCAFDFATSPQQLYETFSRIPLVVEVWDKDKARNQTTLLGTAALPMSQVLVMDKVRALHSSGISGSRQIWDDHVLVVSPDSSQNVGELNVIISLEDWGPLTSHNVVVGAESSTATDSLQPQPQPKGRSPEVKTSPRETLEYKAAMELELWKEKQEEIFKNQLKSKEMQHMHALAEEWKKRDKEREVMVQKKIAEYARLEEQLKRTIAELDKRDKQLIANEQEVMRLRTDLQREHERKMVEMREASRRMKEDCEHQIQLEKTKNKELEDYNARLKQQLSEAENKNHSLEKDFAVYKEQQNCKPEVRLQSEINLLTLEKVELERKLDSLTKSKVHYKQQWGRALKELAKMKQREQAVAKQQLKKQQQELEHMRLRYLAAEEKEVVKSEKQELEDIKNELNQLKQTESDKSQGESHTQGWGTPPESGMRPLQPDTETGEDHITRLIEERDTLLRTGVYTSEDRIIAELDRQIREAIAKKGR